MLNFSNLIFLLFVSAINPHLSLLDGHNVVIRSDIIQYKESKVSLLTGGGSGHGNDTQSSDRRHFNICNLQSPLLVDLLESISSQ